MIAIKPATRRQPIKDVLREKKTDPIPISQQPGLGMATMIMDPTESSPNKFMHSLVVRFDTYYR